MTDHEKRLGLGSVFTYAVGWIVIAVMAFYIAMVLVSLARPEEPWRAKPFSRVDYSLAELRAFRADVTSDMVVTHLVKLIHGVDTGVAVLVLTAFGLRRGRRWGWWSLLAILLWTGLAESAIFVPAGRFPVPLVVMLIGLAGLWIARPAVFAPAKK